jgi:hypothetical protein
MNSTLDIRVKFVSLSRIKALFPYTISTIEIADRDIRNSGSIKIFTNPYLGLIMSKMIIPEIIGIANRLDISIILFFVLI